MKKICANRFCKHEWDTWDHQPVHKHWCSLQCYFEDLDYHLENKRDERRDEELSEDDWREDR